jgi:hypothetical protein
MSSDRHGKTEPGTGQKPDDKWVVPLCRGHHTAQHACGEKSFWEAWTINPLDIAAFLWAASGDEEAALRIIGNVKRILR